MTTRDSQLSRDEMLAAMRANDARYDGAFYVGVHSTGIYCLPSCGARLPREDNVRFYRTREEALAAGLRACKRCRPHRFPDLLPSWVPSVIEYLCRHRRERLSEQELTVIAGVDATTMRRHFKKYLGVTPLQFSRMLRLSYARELIDRGEDYLTVAYAIGYNSPGAFCEAYRKSFGQDPNRRVYGR